MGLSIRRPSQMNSCIQMPFPIVWPGRENLLASTEHNVDKIKARVDVDKLTGADEIGLRVGKMNQHKVASTSG